MRRTIALLLAIALLSACGAGAPRQTAETDSYTVTFELAGAGMDERVATVEVTDKSGQAVDAEQVVIAPVMRDMGMASPEVVAQRERPGRYTARGAFFSMLGEWEMDVRVSAGGAEETASFTVQVE
ncbi:MAG: hypothetical protein RLZZ387_5734 [Chloroflexota bacterium]|jgi:hypothetical protein